MVFRGTEMANLYKSSMTTRGRVTLPKALLDLRGWKSGDRFEVEELPEGVLLRRISEDVPQRQESRAKQKGRAKSATT